MIRWNLRRQGVKPVLHDIRGALDSTLRELAFPTRAFKPRTAVGIDIGASSIKAAKLITVADEHRVVNWAIKERQPARGARAPDRLKRQVRAVLDQIGGPGDHTALNLSGPQVRIHQISLPELPARELDQAVDWQVQKELGAEATPVYVGYEIREHWSNVPEAALQVLAVSVPQNHLDELLGALEPLQVHRVGVTAEAYTNLLTGVHHGKGSGGYAVVDIRNDGTWICIFRRGALITARHVSVAGRLFTQSLMQPIQTADGPLRYSREEAEKTKREKALNLDNPVSREASPDYFSLLLRPAVEKLSAEVERTLANFTNANAGDPIAHVYLSGGGSLLKGLPAAMSDRLDFPVERLSPSLAPALEEPDTNPMGPGALRLAGAIGTALGWESPTNLIPRLRRTTLTGAIVQAVLFWVGTTLLAGIPLLAGITEVGALRLNREFERAHEQSAALETHQESLSELARERSRVASMRNLVTLLPKGQSVLPQVFKELAVHLSSGVVLNSISVDGGPAHTSSVGHSGQRQVFLTGEVHGPPEDLEARLMDFLLNLRRSRFYSAPVVLRKDQVYRGAEAGIEFDIVCTLN